jgi:hypothetical protein
MYFNTPNEMDKVEYQEIRVKTSNVNFVKLPVAVLMLFHKE